MKKIPLIYLLADQEDLPLLKELEGHLGPLQSEGLLRVFAEHHIKAGATTLEVVNEHLAQADAIVPLLSSDFLNSKALADRVKVALARKTTVVPVLLRHCLWQYGVLKSLKSLPSSGRPVTDKANRDVVWQDVVKELLLTLGIGDDAPVVKVSPKLDATPSVVTKSAPPVQRHALLLVAVTAEGDALLEEVREQAISFGEDQLNGRYLDTFTLPNPRGDFRVLVGQSTEKGAPAAQSLVEDLVRAYQPEVILMVGMCGGLSEHGATETGVLVARQVFSYESARLRGGESPWSPTTYRASARITDLANALARRRKIPEISILANKDFGSGAKLIDDLASELRQRLLSFSEDLVGVEMEGHGMLHALWELQRNNVAVQAGLIKGFSDFADGKQREDKKARQNAATRRAVRLALQILRDY